MLDEFAGQLIVVEHHVDDTLEIPWTDQRSSWYWASSKPHVRIDGIYMKMGASSCASAAEYYRGLIEQRLTETEGLSPIQVGGGYWIDGDSLRVVASFELLDEITLVDTQAHVILSEDDVLESGLSLDHLTRAAQSLDITLSEVGEIATASASFYLDPSWNPDKFHCVACLQRMGYENEDKEIYQAAFLAEGFSEVPSNQVPTARSRLSLAPNPFVCRGQGKALTIRLSWASEAERAAQRPGEFRVVDVLGRTVSLITHLEADGRAWRATWDGRGPGGSSVPGGSYWLKAETPQGSLNGRILILK